MGNKSMLIETLPNMDKEERLANLQKSIKSDAISQAQADKLKGPGHFFYIPKTSVSIMSYREAEVYSIKQLLEYVAQLSRKYQKFPEMGVQKKYDGVDSQLHRLKDGSFKVFTEQGKLVTSRLPSLIKYAEKNFPDVPYIVVGEIELWINGKHGGREETSGYLNAKTDPNDSNIVWSLFDVVFFEEDIHSKTYSERYSLLREKFNIRQSLLGKLKPGFNAAPTFVVKDENQLEKAVLSVSKPDDSEGAIIKIWNGFKFTLNQRTNEMIKFKKFAEGHFIVLEKRKIEGSKQTFQYTLGVSILPSEKDTVDLSRTQEYGDKLFLICGKTFNTNIPAIVGDILTVRFGNLFVYRKENKTYIGIYAANVYENRSKSGKSEAVDSLSSLMDIGQESGLLVEKGIGHYIMKIVDAFINYPPESREYKYVIQEHFRGKSAHADLRFETAGSLIGYTLMNQIPGVIKEPVETLAQAKELINNSELWKFDIVKGKFQQRRTSSGDVRLTNIQCALKEPMPKEWLEVEGVAPVGEVGSTANFSGVFVIGAKGQIEFGFREPYFHEYFIHNDKWSGGGQRIVFRLLSGPELRDKYLIRDILDPLTDNPDEFIVESDRIVYDSGFIPLLGFEIDRTQKYIYLNNVYYGDVPMSQHQGTINPLWFMFEAMFGQPGMYKLLPPAEEPGRELPFVWLMVKPNSNEPYLFTARARRKEKIPPPGISAIPLGLRKQIVNKDLRYWDTSSRTEALDRLTNLRAALKAEELKLNYDIIFKKSSDHEWIQKSSPVQYILKKRYWRGPIVIRLGPSAMLYDLYIQQDNDWLCFTVTQNPLEYGSFAGSLRKNISKEEAEFEGEIAPGASLNPNKELPVQVKIIDRGQLSLKEEDLKYSLVCTQGEMKGKSFVATRDEHSSIWMFVSD